MSNPIVSAALPFALGPAGLGLSTLSSAGVGAGLGALSGNGIKGIASGALGAASGGIGDFLGGQIASSAGLSGALSNAIGRGATTAVASKLGGADTASSLLSGGLSGVGSLYQSGAFNNMGKAFRENGLSGALAQFDANTPGAGDVLKMTSSSTAPTVIGGGQSSYANMSNSSFLPSGERIDWKSGGQTPLSSGEVINWNTPRQDGSTGGILDKLTNIGDGMFKGRTGSGLESVLNAGLSTYGNDKAAKEMMRYQREGLAALQPILDQQFDPSKLADDAGYQFQLRQGLGALDSANAARGNFFSGDALRAAGDYASGLANSTVNDAYNRFANTRNQNLSGVMQKYGILGDMGSTKAQSTINKNNAYMQSISNFLNPQSSFDQLMARYLGARS